MEGLVVHLAGRGGEHNVRVNAIRPGRILTDKFRAWLGDGGYDLVNTERFGGTRSAISGPLWDAVESFVESEEPGAAPAPICVAGFTDSHWMRDAFGTIAYGFFPARAMPPEEGALLIHSANERVPVDDLELGVRFLRHAARAMLG